MPRPDPAIFGRVAVLMGGNSAEREISLRSGRAVLEALVGAGVEAVGLDARGDFLRRLADEGFDRAFIALHGRGGEDGVVQGALETIGLPYTGSGVLGSALSMDKVRSKQVWQAAGLPTPDFEVLGPDTEPDAVAARLGLPFMVKPAREGSSIGASRVERAGDLPAAWAAARAFDEVVIAERWIGGGEYTVALLGARALPVIRVETPRGMYDYVAKYEARDTRYHCPAGLDEGREAAFRDLARRAFAALDASGWGRVDILVDDAGDPWLLENNTVPGMTDHSLVPMAARAAGLGFDELCLAILETSLAGDEGGRGHG